MIFPPIPPACPFMFWGSTSEVLRVHSWLRTQGLHLVLPVDWRRVGAGTHSHPTSKCRPQPRPCPVIPAHISESICLSLFKVSLHPHLSSRIITRQKKPWWYRVWVNFL